METVKADVAIIGAGGAGLRAAIALAQADPKLRIALISKVYPMRSHTCAAEGGAAGVIKPDDSLEHHFNDTVGGGDWLCDQDAVDYLVQEAPKELIQLEHWGCPWSREAERLGGGAAVRRHEEAAHLVRRRQVGLPHPAYAVPDLAAVRLDPALRRVLRDRAAGGRGPLRGPRRDRDAQRPDAALRCARGDHRRRRRRAHVPVHHQRRDQDRRRHGAGLPRRRAAQGHGVRAVPPDRAAQHRHAADRGLPRRGRRAAQQERPPLPAGLRHGAGDAARQAGVQDHGARPARPGQPGVLARAEERQHGAHPVGRLRCCSTCGTWARRRSTSACRWCATCPSATWASIR